jgi:integrase
VRFHDTRHSYGSWLEDAGIPPSAIGALLGHATPGMRGDGPEVTFRYLHQMPGVLDRVVAALDQRLPGPASARDRQAK